MNKNFDTEKRKIEQLEKQLNTIKEIYKTKESLISEFDKHKLSIATSIKDSDKILKFISKRYKVIEALRDQYLTLEKEISNFRNKIDKYTSSIQTWIAKQEEKYSKFKKYKTIKRSVKENIKTEISQLNQILSEYGKIEQVLRAENQNIQTKKNEKIKEIRDKIGEKRNLVSNSRKKISKLRAERRDLELLQHKIRRMHVDIHRLISKIFYEFIRLNINLPNIPKMHSKKDDIISEQNKNLVINIIESISEYPQKEKVMKDKITQLLPFNQLEILNDVYNLSQDVFNFLKLKLNNLFEKIETRIVITKKEDLLQLIERVVYSASMNYYHSDVEENYSKYNNVRTSYIDYTAKETLNSIKSLNDEIKSIIKEEKKMIQEISSYIDETILATGYDISLNLFLSKSSPILMFPLRLETKYVEIDKKDELWIRVYPDNLLIETHEEGMTKSEYFDGKELLKDLWWAAYQKEGVDIERIKISLKHFADKHGTGRVIYVIHTFQELGFDNIIGNWNDRPSIAAKVDDDGNPIIEEGYPDLIHPEFMPDQITEFKPDTWTETPKVYLMPDYFIFDFYRMDDEGKHTRVLQKIGNPIDTPLMIFPDVLAEEDLSTEIFFDEASKWMSNFEIALSKGMGMIVSEEDDNLLTSGYSRILVYGVKISNENEVSRDQIQSLLKNHLYTEGIQLLRSGTPTNNVVDAESQIKTELGKEYLYNSTLNTPLIGDENGQLLEDDENKDGYLITRCLGLENTTFSHIMNADKQETMYVRNMMNALWPATMGYFLEKLLGLQRYNYAGIPDIPTFSTGEDLDFSIRYQAKYHAINFVNPRGFLSGIKIGNNPYGILPASSIEEWIPSTLDEFWRDREYPPSKVIHDRNFSSLLNNVMKSLKPTWLNLAKNPDKVPRVGGTDDSDSDLLKILGMEASSRNLQLIPKIDLAHIWSMVLLGGYYYFGSYYQVLQNLLQALGFSQVTTSNPTPFDYQLWWHYFLHYEYVPVRNILEKFHEEDPNINPNLDPLVVGLISWGNGFDIFETTEETNLIHNLNISEKTFLEILESHGNQNFIQFIRNSNAYDLFIETDHPSDSLLYNLLMVSKILQNYESDIPEIKDLWHDVIGLVSSLDQISTLSTAELERLLGEVLDSFSHRLDSIITSMYTRRLWNMRIIDQSDPIGSHIGAFGWVEDLQKRKKTDPQGGYIFAPSNDQAISAAIARNAFLTYRLEEDKELMTTKLSSDRVRRSLWILEGLKNKQSLNTLLGYQFEKALHENYEDIELDKYIFPLRRLYPIEKKVDEISGDLGGETVSEGDTDSNINEAEEVIEPQNVVDGIKLLAAWIATKENSSEKIPFGNYENLPASGNDYNAIIKELGCLDDQFDALQDIGVFENIFHTIRGNYDRAPVILDILAGKGGNIPEIESLKTPGGGLTYSQALMILIEDNPNVEIDKWLLEDPENYDHTNPPLMSPMDEADPHLRNWIAKLLGDPSRIKCLVRHLTDPTKTQFLTLQDVALDQRFGPLDFISMLSKSPLEKESELEKRISHTAMDKLSVTNRSEIEIEYLPVNYPNTTGWDVIKDLSFLEIIPLAKKIQEMISNSVITDPSKFMLAEQTHDENIDIHFEVLEINNLRSRIAALLENLKTLLDDLKNLVIDAQFQSNAKQLFFKISLFGLADAVPNLKDNHVDEEYNELLILLRDNIFDVVKKRIEKYTTEIAKFDEIDISLPSTRKRAISSLMKCGKVLFGETFTLLPIFSLSPEINNEFSMELSKDPSILLDEENLDYPYFWMHQVGYTRPKTKLFGEVCLGFEALNDGTEIDLQVIQFSNTPDLKWLSLPNATEDISEPILATRALIIHKVGNINPANNKYCGLIIDEWSEEIVSPKIKGAIAYHFNKPNTEPPQIMLLLVPPTVEMDLYNYKIMDTWSFNDIANILNDTLDLLKIRGVDTYAMLGRVRTFLPGIYIPHQYDASIPHQHDVSPPGG